jgi:ABC-type transporter Mla subunit MlaD
MPPRISWRNLLPGLIAIAALILLAVGVMVFAGVGRIRGEKMRLYVVTNQARGLMRGSDVWLEGQKVGVVDDVHFAPVASDSSARVVILITVKVRDAGSIRRDSRVQVRAGANIIGPVVVYIETGSPGIAAARDGDTLRARAQSDLELAGTKLEPALSNFPPIISNTRAVLGSVRDPDGTVGAALRERGGSDFARLRANVARLRERMAGSSAGAGAMGRARLRSHASAALARVDSIRTLVASTSSSYGRFRRDTSLAGTVAHARDELAQLRQRMDSADGTLARVSTDSALTRAVADAQREMAVLFADIRHRPMRYITF